MQRIIKAVGLSSSGMLVCFATASLSLSACGGADPSENATEAKVVPAKASLETQGRQSRTRRGRFGVRGLLPKAPPNQSSLYALVTTGTDQTELYVYPTRMLTPSTSTPNVRVLDRHCVRYDGGIDGVVDYPEAGRVTARVGNEEYDLPLQDSPLPDGGHFRYYFLAIPKSFQAGTPIRMTISGQADVPRITLRSVVPDPVTLTSPVAGATQARSAPLDIDWQGPRKHGPVMAGFGTDTATVYCEWDLRDGHAQIPSAAFFDAPNPFYVVVAGVDYQRDFIRGWDIDFETWSFPGPVADGPASAFPITLE